jgi:hypothetical protein
MKAGMTTAFRARHSCEMSARKMGGQKHLSKSGGPLPRNIPSEPADRCLGTEVQRVYSTVLARSSCFTWMRIECLDAKLGRNPSP